LTDDASANGSAGRRRPEGAGPTDGAGETGGVGLPTAGGAAGGAPLSWIDPALTRVGLLGGTFDPIHFGHLAIAEEVAEALDLERVLFVPAARPPHKLDDDVTAGADRAEMIRLAIADNPRFGLCRIELERTGPSGRRAGRRRRALRAQCPVREHGVARHVFHADSRADLRRRFGSVSRPAGRGALHSRASAVSFDQTR
jgi:cytidyltransferase-like protein